MSELQVELEKKLEECLRVLRKASNDKARGAKQEIEYAKAFQNLVNAGCRKQFHRPKFYKVNYIAGNSLG